MSRSRSVVVAFLAVKYEASTDDVDQCAMGRNCTMLCHVPELLAIFSMCANLDQFMAFQLKFNFR